MKVSYFIHFILLCLSLGLRRSVGRNIMDPFSFQIEIFQKKVLSFINKASESAIEVAKKKKF